MVRMLFVVCIIVETMLSTVAGNGFVHKAHATTAARVGFVGIIFSVVEVCLLLFLGWGLYSWTMKAFTGGALTATDPTAVVPFIMFSCILSINLLLNSILLNYHTLPYSTIYVGGFILLFSRILLLLGLVCHLSYAPQTKHNALFYQILLGVCVLTTFVIWLSDTIAAQVIGWIAIVCVMVYGIGKLCNG
jgi:hypothetical protein